MTRGLAGLGAVLCLAACSTYGSVRPLTRGTQTDLPGIEGLWRIDIQEPGRDSGRVLIYSSAPTTHDLERTARPTTYFMRQLKWSGRPGMVFRATVHRVTGRLWADLQVVELSTETADDEGWGDVTLYPLHYLVRMDLQGDTVRLRHLDVDTLAARLRRRPHLTPYHIGFEDEHSRLVVLTGSSSEVTRFLGSYGREPGALMTARMTRLPVQQVRDSTASE